MFSDGWGGAGPPLNCRGLWCRRFSRFRFQSNVWFFVYSLRARLAVGQQQRRFVRERQVLRAVSHVHTAHHHERLRGVLVANAQMGLPSSGHHSEPLQRRRLDRRRP